MLRTQSFFIPMCAFERSEKGMIFFMSYAIIRNKKYKSANIALAYRHNERKNSHYSNKNIDKSRTHI